MIAISIALGAVAGLVLGGVYYAIVPATATPAHQAPTRPAVAQILVELLRSAAVAGLLAVLLTAAGVSGVGTGILLGLILWVLPLVLLVGSAFHEGTPIRVAAQHAGDWLIKLPALGALVGAFA